MTDTAESLGLKISQLANPTRFMALTGTIVPWTGAIAMVLLAAGLWLTFTVPQDYQQGNTVRIMFIHVPSVMMAMAAYMVMVSGALGTLVWRHPLADVAAKSAAPIGAVLTFAGLVTGSIWGKPMWGTWWEWDARLTSFLILLVIYLGVIALWRAIEEPSTAAKLTAVAILVGALILPVIHFSVEWWNTLHQPNGTVTRAPTIYRTPLWLMIAGFGFGFLTLHLAVMRNELMARRIRTLQRFVARSADRAR